MLVGDPCQDEKRQSTTWPGIETFFQVTLAMNCLQYVFFRLRGLSPSGFQGRIRFLNSELPSVRLRPRMVLLLNKIMYNHILTALPFAAGNQNVDGWLRRGQVVHLAGQPLFPAMRSGASWSDEPQLVWVTLPPMRCIGLVVLVWKWYYRKRCLRLSQAPHEERWCYDVHSCIKCMIGILA